MSVEDLRGSEFDAAHAARALRRAVFDHGALDQIPALAAAERALQQASDARAAQEQADGVGSAKVLMVKPTSTLLGPTTTGLDVKVGLRMSAIPTSLIHVFDAEKHPLVSCDIHNGSLDQKTKRLRLISFVEGYSARAVQTLEVGFNRRENPSQLPTFFPERLAHVTELTRASVNVEVQDLDARTEVHTTVPVWLLARTSAPLQMQDPSTGKWVDMTRYLGAYVTPNATAVMRCLRDAANRHPLRGFVGYQKDEAAVRAQVQAIYEELAARGIAYVNSVIDFTPEAGSNTQRVRPPRETLENKSANCIDGTLLMASLLEAASLNPALIIVPGHAFLAWETGRNNGKWSYLETTMMATNPFDDAAARGEALAAQWTAADAALVKRHSIRDLRASGITPLE